MNEPRRPDAEWIAGVRAQNRAKLGLAGLGQDEQPVAGWKVILIMGVLGYLYWKWSS